MCCGGGKSCGSRSTLQLCLLLVLILANGAAGRLQVGFYRRSCPNAESIVRRVAWAAASSDPSLAAKLLRLFFHDCFPQGCDASVLLDGPDSEKTAFPNQSLGGLDVVDAAKAALESSCPGVVSCADALALATRDAVSFQFGRPLWAVATGRRDSRAASRAADGLNVPHPDFDFPRLRAAFAGRNLSVADLVALSGAHTLGRASCRFVAAPELRRRLSCPDAASANMMVPMDPGSEFRFDGGYFAAVKANRAVLLSDAALMQDAKAARLVDEFRDQGKFVAAFAKSITRMGAIGVLTGNDGDIRRNCRALN
ncbi:hypothetical protein PR202_ga28981 [Eleusine coracana subsp. coracana]|uniref:Peroxidase n=1 Tax=Eleusine coracana subsp. coracana TaxID=191504 RepID=A0AAV5DJY1_ELECO|nr:hypothetical protein QOZ80_7AG0579540 [Eleusine coracana subsp. coracana]GJN10848.1 hypothetical protein PR202_ga28981 [Eleusine coracana subsp. coracana]